MTAYHINDILITPMELALRVDELAREIAAGGPSENLAVIGILRGSFIFLADLVRWFDHNGLRPRIDFMIMESYGSGTTAHSSGSIQAGSGLPTMAMLRRAGAGPCRCRARRPLHSR